MGNERTVRLKLELALPDSLVKEAEASGLLEPESLGSLLRDELRRRRAERFFAAADRLAALDEPPLTEAELEAEIAAVRAQRHSSHARGR